MSLDVRITDTAREALGDLEAERRNRIVGKLEDVRDFPEHYLDRLTNIPGYKLRVGDFRVVVDWDREEEILYVVAILKRRRDYRELAGIREVWGSWRG